MKTYDQILSDQIEAKRRLLGRLRGKAPITPVAHGMIARVEGEITAYTTAINVYRSMTPKSNGFDDVLLTQMGEIAEELLEVDRHLQPFPVSWRNLYGEEVLKELTLETVIKLAQSAVSLTVGDPEEGETFYGRFPEFWTDQLLAAWSKIPELASLDEG